MMFVELGKQQKDIASMLGVSEVTISKWAKDENWKAARTALLTTNDNMLENGKRALANLSDIMLDLQAQRAKAVEKGDKMEVATIDAQLLSTADAIAKTGATFNKFEKSGKITLVTYLNVMDGVFKALQNEDPKLHALTMDFQERHIQDVAKKLG